MSRRKDKRKGRRGPRLNISPKLQVEMLAITLVAVAGITVLSLLSAKHGTLIETWLRLLRLGFGWGMYAVPLGLGALGLWLLMRDFSGQLAVRWEGLFGAGLLFVVGLAWLHLLSFPPDPRQLAAEGGGGGYLGWFVSQRMTSGIGYAGTYIALLALGGVALIMLFNLSISQMGETLGESWRRLVALYHIRFPRIRVAQPPKPVKGKGFIPQWLKRVTGVGPPPTEEAQLPAPRRGPLFPRIIGGGQEWRLPPIAEILEENIEQEFSQAEIRRRVRIIEDTLASFGVPARVVEVNQGPTVTQFGVEPGYIERKDQEGRIKRRKVKVSAISSLAKDLALALAASPIRVQAPVPGRPVVGIEVPNTEVSLVGLRGVMESEEFQALESKLRLALGKDVSGRAIVADLATMPHLLIAGATGSGKSFCIKAIVATLLFDNTPDELRLLMIDPKGVELTGFEGVPHLLGPVVTDARGVVEALGWVIREMERRYGLFAEAGVRNIDGYNELGMNGLLREKGRNYRSSIPEQTIQRGRLPRIVVVIDELADLMLVSPEEMERGICRIAQLARATGIHMVMATQRPSVDVVTGLIKANFPARISFAVTSQVDSRVILDVGGAEKLLGRGDMLYIASDTSKLVRLQGSFVSDKELGRLVDFWKGFQVPPDFRVGKPVQQPLWSDMVAKDKPPLGDDLLEEAIKLVRGRERVSASFLQRRLRIGRSRAERLMELMEERGIIAPAEGASARRGSRRVLRPTEQADASREKATTKGVG